MRAAGLAAAVGVLLIYLLRPKPLAVETGIVETGPLRITVNEEGRTRARDTFIVSAPVAGHLERISLRQGDRVDRDMVVARLTPAPLDERGRALARARLDAAEDSRRAAQARVEKARAALDQARRTRARAESLVARGVESVEKGEEAALAESVAAKEAEAADYGLQVAGHELEGARAELLATDPAGEAKGLFEVRAPVGGRVLRVHAQSEQVLSPGTPLLEIGDTEAMEIVVDVLSEDAVRIRPGDPILVDAGDELGTMQARVRIVEPSAFTKVSALGVDEQRVHVVGDLLQPPGRLGDGYRVEAGIVIWQSDSALVVPSSALFRRGTQWAVFAVQGERARARAVEVGRRNAERAEVLRGLVKGERVILYPDDRVEEGVRVRPTRAE
jgi:HlyD family secretion protein